MRTSSTPSSPSAATRRASPLSRAFSIIEEGAGTHFDPHIAHAFLDARDDAAAIATEYGDGQTDKIPWVPTGTAAPPPQTSAF